MNDAPGPARSGRPELSDKAGFRHGACDGFRRGRISTYCVPHTSFGTDWVPFPIDRGLFRRPRFFCPALEPRPEGARP